MSDPLTILTGDVRQTLQTLPEKSVHCCITSPPYWGLRSYYPNCVKLRSDISPKEAEMVILELDSLGIKPMDHIG